MRKKLRPDPTIVLLAIGQTLAWASIYYIFPALFLRWEQDFGWSKAELTVAITMAVLVSALVSPITGRIIDRGHGPLLVGASALLGGFALVLLSYVEQLWQFYSAWGLLGVAMGGCLYEPCFALVTRSRGQNAKHAIILITLIAGFASTISYPVMYSLAEAFGWRGAVRVAAAIEICAVAPILWFSVHKLEQPLARPTMASEETGGSRAFMHQPAFWFLASGFACIAIAHGAALHHLLPILDERGMSAEMAVLAASFIGPMQVAGRLAMMASERYLSIQGVAFAAFGALGLSIALLLIGASSPAFLAGFVILFGSAYGTVSILRPLLAREILGGSSFGAKSGALALPYLAGSAIAPFLASLVWGWGGYNLVLSTLLGVVLLGCFLYWKAQNLAKAQSL